MAQRRLLKAAIEAIKNLNSDTTVPDTKTLDYLEEVYSVVEDMMMGLREQIKNREGNAS